MEGKKIDYFIFNLYSKYKNVVIHNEYTRIKKKGKKRKNNKKYKKNKIILCSCTKNIFKKKIEKKLKVINQKFLENTRCMK